MVINTVTYAAASITINAVTTNLPAVCTAEAEPDEAAEAEAAFEEAVVGVAFLAEETADEAAAELEEAKDFDSGVTAVSVFCALEALEATLLEEELAEESDKAEEANELFARLSEALLVITV